MILCIISASLFGTKRPPVQIRRTRAENSAISCDPGIPFQRTGTGGERKDRGRDPETALSDLRSSCWLVRPAHAVGGRQGRGDPGAASSARGAAPSGRPSSDIVGRPRIHLSASPAPALYPEGRTDRYAWYVATLARGPGEAALDLQAQSAGPPADPAGHPRAGAA